MLALLGSEYPACELRLDGEATAQRLEGSDTSRSLLGAYVQEP